jgi:hypothetical protein
VYGELGLQWNAATTGSVADEVSTVLIDEVRHALLAEYEHDYRLEAARLTAADLAAGRALLARHRVA